MIVATTSAIKKSPAKKQVPYTPEQTAELIDMYVNQKLTASEIAAKLNKTSRSVISKLVCENVYVSKHTMNPKPKRVLKDEILEELNKLLGLSGDELDSLAKASNFSLSNILEALK